MSPVMCQMSNVTCNMSGVMCNFFKDKVLELVSVRFLTRVIYALGLALLCVAVRLDASGLPDVLVSTRGAGPW